MLAALLSPNTFRKNLRSPSPPPVPEKAKSGNASSSNLLELIVPLPRFNDTSVTVTAPAPAPARLLVPPSPRAVAAPESLPVPIPSVVPAISSSPVTPPSSLISPVSSGSGSSPTHSQRSSSFGKGFWNGNFFGGGGLLVSRTKEIEFTVPQTLSPLTPTFGRKALGPTSVDSSPAGSLSGSRSETDPSTSRANTPSPIFFRACGTGSGSDIAGACTSIACSLGGLNPELYKTTKVKNGDGDDDSDDEGSDDEGRGLDGEYGGGHERGPDQQPYYGHVKFALEYDTAQEKLLVTRVRARNLVAKGGQSPSSSYGYGYSGSSSSSAAVFNPFVRVSLFPDERRTLQSKPRSETRHPRFGEVFGFQVSNTGLDERSLKLCFYDVDQNKKHCMLGYIVQPLKDIDWSFGKQVFKQDLLRDIGELSPNIGEVLVSLCYNGTISRLTVTLFEARGIKTCEAASGLYAKIQFSQHTKVIKTKKTSTVALLGCRSNFNDSFHFKLPAEQLDTASVSIQLMYAQPGYNKDQPAGRIVLGSFMFARGKGLDHWTEMLSRQKEQVQYWHAIAE